MCLGELYGSETEKLLEVRDVRELREFSGLGLTASRTGVDFSLRSVSLLYCLTLVLKDPNILNLLRDFFRKFMIKSENN